jgi:antitoxin component YwqK of YwqJK toxin-antitoxin module
LASTCHLTVHKKYETKKIVLGLILFISAENILGQTNQEQRLIVPGLDPASQNNVVVTICDLNGRQPCLPKYANSLSNTNLFSLEEQKTIREVFEKYKNVTTNSCLPDTVLVGLHKTNYVITTMGRTKMFKSGWRVTNTLILKPMKRFGRSLVATFQSKTNEYPVYSMRPGNGTMLRFTEKKNGLINGLLATFEDNYSQGTNWDFRLAKFTDRSLTEYRQYTNGMALGNFFMWNPQNNNLSLEAEFKEPYDFEKHRLKRDHAPAMGRHERVMP